MNQKIFIASGGTGGHIMPARTLANALTKENYQVTFLGDSKIKSYIKEEDEFKSKIIISSQVSKSPISLLKASVKISLGLLQSLILFLLIRPKFVFAFGGYATFPILLAAIITGKKIILHEQNAHLGKVNRIFAKYAYKIATSFPDTSGVTRSNLERIIFTGNPIREEILKLGDLPYQVPQESKKTDSLDNRMGYNILLASDFKNQKEEAQNLFKILIIGGSGGAKIFSEVLPKAFFNLSERIKDKIQITQQCRPEMVHSTFEQYCSYNINIAADKFFNNMPELIQNAHLVIARAGSSSIFEFCAAKKPMILIPFAASADNHQMKNAAYLKENNAAIIINEKDFNITEVSEILKDLIDNEAKLKEMANNAGKLAVRDATTKLINLVK
jgi:UDP-N-acetylglucosamine--N-acetylmuramyl-(pentapeptide) pyrophosphoryl-undecaprenol N-acetylglucosamine transferase